MRSASRGPLYMAIILLCLTLRSGATFDSDADCCTRGSTQVRRLTAEDPRVADSRAPVTWQAVGLYGTTLITQSAVNYEDAPGGENHFLVPHDTCHPIDDEPFMTNRFTDGGVDMMCDIVWHDDALALH